MWTLVYRVRIADLLAERHSRIHTTTSFSLFPSLPDNACSPLPLNYDNRCQNKQDTSRGALART
jgi:hypothetical protein